MTEILDDQVCPYCEYVVEDSQSVWGVNEEEEVTCSHCDKVYISKPQYKFEGWLIETQCGVCGEFTEDDDKVCDCNEYSANY